MLTGSAPGNQDIDVAGLAQLPKSGRAKLRAQIAIDGHRLDTGWRLHPARVRIFLVLLLHHEGNAIVNAGKARDRRPNLPFLTRFHDLLCQHAGNRIGPRTVQQAFGRRQRVQREIGGNGRRPRRRDSRVAFERSDESIAQFSSLLQFLFVVCKDVLIDKALARQRTIKLDCRFLNASIGSTPKQCVTGCGQKPLHFHVPYRS